MWNLFFLSRAIIAMFMHVNAHRWRSDKQERQNIPFASYIVFKMHTRSEKKTHTTSEESFFFLVRLSAILHHIINGEQARIILGINDKRKKEEKKSRAIQTSKHTWAHKPYIEVGKLWRCPIKRLLQSVFFSFRLLFWSLLLLLWFCINKYK